MRLDADAAAFALAGEEERPPFAFAGLWRQGQLGVDREASHWATHTMMTTEANDLVRPVHPTRMPVILAPEDYETWLMGTAEQAAALLRPYPAEGMRIVREAIGTTSDLRS
ncbi:SOS response-associated peptidase family protein [Cereibacter azotoformans]|uniref:SOS response-associated peptidase family protein n=1 Tax=Cereibacter azotoformans TaxID=43057 RepID=UPI001F4282EE|nr:SOS response-associated peptidase family protein [Cereibacter azotoformans]